MSKPFNEADHPRHSNGRFDNKPDAATSGADLGGGQHLSHPAPSVEDDPRFQRISSTRKQVGNATETIYVYTDGETTVTEKFTGNRMSEQSWTIHMMESVPGKQDPLWRSVGKLHREDGPAYTRFYPGSDAPCFQLWQIEGEPVADQPCRIDYRKDGSVSHYATREGKVRKQFWIDKNGAIERESHTNCDCERCEQERTRSGETHQVFFSRP